MRYVHPALQHFVRLTALSFTVIVATVSTPCSDLLAAADDVCPIQCSDADRPVVEKIWRAWKTREDAFKSVKITWAMSAHLTAPDRSLLPPNTIAIEESGIYDVEGMSLILEKKRFLYTHLQILKMQHADRAEKDYYLYDHGDATDYTTGSPWSGPCAFISTRAAGAAIPFADATPVFASYLPLHETGLALANGKWRVIRKEELNSFPANSQLATFRAKEASNSLMYIEVEVQSGWPYCFSVDLENEHCPIVVMESFMTRKASRRVHYTVRFSEYRVEPQGVLTPIEWDFYYYSGLKPLALESYFQCELSSSQVNDPGDEKLIILPAFKEGTIITDHREKVEQ